MKEITSVHNAAVQLCGSFKNRGRVAKTAFLFAESAKLVGEAVAAARSDALYRKRARGGICADDRAGGKRGLRAVRHFNGGDAGSQHGENAAGRRLHGTDSPSRRSAAGRRLVALDRVQDPGNVGTILRTADAAGLTARSLGPGCADLYGAKTLGATMGSVFPRAGAADERPAGDVGSDEARGGYAVAATELGGQDFLRLLPARQGDSGDRQRRAGPQQARPRRGRTIWRCRCAAARNRSTRRLPPAL